MKKNISIFCAVLLALTIPLTVYAADELTSCTVTADLGDAVIFIPGETVDVDIRISDNPGFTNFAVALDYDHNALTLKKIATTEMDAEGVEKPYLCGSQVSTNIEWKKNDKTFGYVVAAAAEPVKDEKGVLFTATFEVKPDFIGETMIDIASEVLYIRNNERVFSVFKDINADINSATVKSVLPGDVDLDGLVEYDDVMLAFKAFGGSTQLTEEQLAVADRNKNGTVDESDYKGIYDIYIGRGQK